MIPGIREGRALGMEWTGTCSRKNTIATAKGMHEADMPISATARFPSSKLTGVLKERFQKRARQTAKFPRIPVRVVIPRMKPTISASPLMCQDPGWSCESSASVNRRGARSGTRQLAGVVRHRGLGGQTRQRWCGCLDLACKNVTREASEAGYPVAMVTPAILKQ